MSGFQEWEGIDSDSYIGFLWGGGNETILKLDSGETRITNCAYTEITDVYTFKGKEQAGEKKAR